VVTGTFAIFPYIGNVIIPTDELHHFSEGQVNHQRDLVLLVTSQRRQAGDVSRKHRKPSGMTGGISSGNNVATTVKWLSNKNTPTLWL